MKSIIRTTLSFFILFFLISPLTSCMTRPEWTQYEADYEKWKNEFKKYEDRLINQSMVPKTIIPEGATIVPIESPDGKIEYKIKGVEKPLTVKYELGCPTGYHEIICHKCNGKGKISWSERGECLSWEYTKEGNLGRCRGYDTEYHTGNCSFCNGDGIKCEPDGVSPPTNKPIKPKKSVSIFGIDALSL